MSSQAASFLPFSLVSLLRFVYLSGWVCSAVLIFIFSYLPTPLFRFTQVSLVSRLRVNQWSPPLFRESSNSGDRVFARNPDASSYRRPCVLLCLHEGAEASV